jgi:flagellar motor protein MotB
MAKIKITQKQYNTILLREQEGRLMGSGEIITETLEIGPEVLEEGWKEVVLGVAMMLGVGLSGQNKAMAQTAVKNAQTMAQVKATLEDTAKTQELADYMEEKGMKDPSALLSKNAERVIDRFNKIAQDNNIKYRVDVKAVDNLQALQSGLKSGYAVKDIQSTSDTVQTPAAAPVKIQDTLNINFGSDNMFITGGYTLSPAGIDVVTIAIKQIEKQGGKILSAEIESSTDAERVPKFISKEDPTGNIKLSDLRTKSIHDLITSLAGDVSIRHREIPNNGSHVVSTQEFLKVSSDANATAELRVKTKEFRYVIIKLVVLMEKPNVAPDEPRTKIIKDYRFELVKVIDTTGNSRKIKTKTKWPHKQWKCKKASKNKPGDCYTF